MRAGPACATETAVGDSALEQWRRMPIRTDIRQRQTAPGWPSSPSRAVVALARRLVSTAHHVMTKVE